MHLRSGGRRPPAVQADGHVDLVCPRTFVERRRDQQVGESAVEGHRRHDADPRGPREGVEVAVERLDHRLLRGHVQVVGAGLHRGARERQGGIEELTGTVDDDADPVERLPEQARVVGADDAALEACVAARPCGQPVGAAAGQHGRQPASLQLVDHEAPRDLWRRRPGLVRWRSPVHPRAHRRLDRPGRQRLRHGHRHHPAPALPPRCRCHPDGVPPDVPPGRTRRE